MPLNMLKSHFIYAAALLLGLWFFVAIQGCYTPKEACLDIAASNFDASADKNCCCIYPNLRLLVTQVYDTLPFIENRVYENENGVFRIKTALFYLSDFTLFQNNIGYTVSDTVALSVLGPTDTLEQLFRDDVLLLRRENIDNVIGVFSQTGLFEKIQFRFGLSEQLNQSLPSKAPSGHPLAVQNEGLWKNNLDDFQFARFIVSADTAANAIPDTLRLTYADLPDFLFQQNINLTHEPGYDFKVGLALDYRVLFKNINWNATPAQIKLTIRDNLSGAVIVY